jgi:hypothetical protein
MHRLSVRRTYALTRRLIEHGALALREQHPELHLADCCHRVLVQRPVFWRTYRAAIQAGLPSEFLRARRRRAVPTPKDRAWDQIEMLARTLVAASAEPLTLRNAVGRVVEANPDLYRRYAAARRR